MCGRLYLLRQKHKGDIIRHDKHELEFQMPSVKMQMIVSNQACVGYRCFQVIARM